jgi:hypothetical protein
MEVRFVHDCPDPSQRLVTVSGNGVTEKLHRAGVSMSEAQQDPDEGCLPCSVGSQIAEGATARNEEFDVVDGDILPEPLGEPVSFDSPSTLRISPTRRLC